MRRIYIDSGSSIKPNEKENYQLTGILPLQIFIDGNEYLDGINLDNNHFYDLLMNKKEFPKTSLPPLNKLYDEVNDYTEKGDEVIIVTISSFISGTYNAVSMLFKDNDKVLVVDSKSCAGGERLVLMEVLKYQNESFEVILEKVNDFIPRIKIMAIPDTLTYLVRGGRLNKFEGLVGSLLLIKPIIGMREGKVHLIGKKHGTKNVMRYLAQALTEFECDPNYPIVASYSYDDKNLQQLISMTDEKYKAQMTIFDDITPGVACHWGPYAYGYIFVGKKESL